MTDLSNLKDYKADDIIIKQGEDGDAAYIIESGTVEILIEKENELIQSLGTRGKGSIIGEMALVDNKPRTATIKALEDCQLLEISREDFNSRLDNTDPVIQMIMQVILARYRDTITRAHILGKKDEIPTPEDLEKGLVHETNAIDEIKLIGELKKALKNDELVFYYQPIMDIAKNQIAGFETLIRWNHPEKGMVFPGSFIEEAENDGIITEISRLAVEKSCETLVEFQKHSDNKNLFTSVNFSAKDFLIPDFRDHLLKTLDSYKLSPDQIHIEITERLLMEQPAKVKELLNKCRECGMLVSIDDFGTGFSSLSYLHYFPIDILKIDRSFINDLEKKNPTSKLVASIISLAHNLDMDVIAEGIEEKDQLKLLKKMKCDKAQGYYFSKPVDQETIINEVLTK